MNYHESFRAGLLAIPILCISVSGCMEKDADDSATADTTSSAQDAELKDHIRSLRAGNTIILYDRQPDGSLKPSKSMGNDEKIDEFNSYVVHSDLSPILEDEPEGVLLISYDSHVKSDSRLIYNVDYLPVFDGAFHFVVNGRDCFIKITDLFQDSQQVAPISEP